MTLIGHKLSILLEAIGATIHWDVSFCFYEFLLCRKIITKTSFQGQKMVTIEATAGLFNRTAGLCGTMDQNAQNDFMSKDGTVHTVSGFDSFDL